MKILNSIERLLARVRRDRTGRVAALALVALAGAGGSAWLSSGVGSVPATVAALAVPPSPDMDGDGLVNALESVLGTWYCHADTDGDGFSDLEEVARR